MKKGKWKNKRSVRWGLYLTFFIVAIFVYCLAYRGNMRLGVAETNTKIAAMNAMTPQAFYKQTRKKLLALRASYEKGLNSYPAWAR